MKPTEILSFVGLLADLTRRLIDAHRAGDVERVDALLPPELRSQIQQRIGNDEAAIRFFGGAT